MTTVSVQYRDCDSRSLKHLQPCPLWDGSAAPTEDPKLPRVRPVLPTPSLACQWTLKIQRPNFKSRLSNCTASGTCCIFLDSSFLTVKGCDQHSPHSIENTHTHTPPTTWTHRHTCASKQHMQRLRIHGNLTNKQFWHSFSLPPPPPPNSSVRSMVTPQVLRTCAGVTRAQARVSSLNATPFSH